MNEHQDTALFAQLRSMWRDVDPVPESLADRMIAVVATDGLAREYALLTLIEQPLEAVRSDTDALTLQFSDGTTSILLHVTATANGHRRVDGWVDNMTAEVVLAQGEIARTTTPGDAGRFVFEDVSRGLARVRLTSGTGHDIRVLETPQFEL